MNMNVFYGILIPFLGTSLGAACVFFMKNTLNDKIQRKTYLYFTKINFLVAKNERRKIIKWTS